MRRRRWLQATLGAGLIVVGAIGLAGTRSWAAGERATTGTHPTMHRMMDLVRDPGPGESVPATDVEQMMARCSQMMDRMGGAGDAGGPAQGSGA